MSVPKAQEDLHLLPKARDSWPHLYVERAAIQDGKAIAIQDAQGITPVPCTALALLMLGPGTTITHAAVNVVAKTGGLVGWTGEGGVRFYAQGLGETRSSRRFLWQARQWADERRRLAVVMQMCRMRCDETLDPKLTLQQVRGREGVRIREAYAKASRDYGVEWTGRVYNRAAWSASDPVNQALSSANSRLYGACHAAIVAAGCSPAIGFVHTGTMLSFVYDIADLSQVEMTIPAAFRAASEETDNLERQGRRHCRDRFKEQRRLARIVTDIDGALNVRAAEGDEDALFDSDFAAPGGLGDPAGTVVGGENYGEIEEALANGGVDS